MATALMPGPGPAIQLFIGNNSTTYIMPIQKDGIIFSASQDWIMPIKLLYEAGKKATAEQVSCLAEDRRVEIFLNFVK